ncbi:unnamed protein product [Staurois parvus]|uniref:Alkaline phosphatase n=1 Tax=Staurois parvus TaxID=386267 RepID=A0ABN9HH71_9NEOB|nr:unnamed protein product [Staurois parvus]
MRGPWRADIVNAGFRGDQIVNAGGPGRADIVNAGSGESANIVNAGSGESGYSECGVRGERI